MTNTPEQSASRSLYTRYWACVDDVIGANVLAKSTALELNEVCPANWDPETDIWRLHAAFENLVWAAPQNPSLNNWVWRPPSDHQATDSHEVRLERAVVRIGGPDLWTYQMSTGSGYFGPYADKRRSIDLVCRRGEGSFRFIELKIESNHPLYAAFEILGYGLAYLHARAHLDPAREDIPEVMRAKAVALEVLAPTDWYQHRSLAAGFELKWLVSGLNAGLAVLLAKRALADLDTMTFAFCSFPRPCASMTSWANADYDKAAQSIVEAYRHLDC